MLPNLLIIGAGKAGTSALHAYLAEHPEVFMSARKELQVLARRGDWQAWLPWYEEHFAGAGDAAIRGESSPVYSVDPYFQHVPERAAGLLEDLRVVYMVREPVSRAIAHWREQRVMRIEFRALDEALGDPDPANLHVCGSRYGHQLARWLEHVPGERVLVLDQSDLRDRRTQTLATTFRFLGVDPAFTSPAWDAEHNTAGGKERVLIGSHRVWQLARKGFFERPVIGPLALRLVSEKLAVPELSPDVRARLEALFAEDGRRFAELRARTWSAVALEEHQAEL